MAEHRDKDGETKAGPRVRLAVPAASGPDVLLADHRAKVTADAALLRPASAHFFDRAAARLFAEPPADAPPEGEPTIVPGFPASPPRDAAVLIPVIDRTEPALLLTRRTDRLATHAGQIAFPGGKIDPDDAGPVACALREAEEEIGLAPDLVSVLGCLPPYLTGTGFRVFPVVARIGPDPHLVLNAAEVAAAFEVPLAFLMDPRNHRRASRVFDGAERHFYEMPFGDHYIWGATAGIIRALYERVYA